MQKLAKVVEKEVLLWEGSLQVSNNVLVTGAKNYKRFKLGITNIGYIYVDKYSATDNRFSGVKTSKINSTNVYFFIFANVIVNQENDNFYNDGCYYTKIQDISTQPSEFQTITEIWGVR